MCRTVNKIESRDLGKETLAMTSGLVGPKATKREIRLEKRVKELSILYEVSKIFTSALELDRALKLIVKATVKGMGVKACGLRLLDEDTGEMQLKAVHGLSQKYIDKGRVFVWKGVYKEVILDGQVAVVDAIAADPRFEYTESAAREGLKSMLSVGLTIQGKTIGALSIYTAQNHVFTRDQIQVFKGIANEAAAVIERAELHEERLENQRMEQELAMAAKIQNNLMPYEDPVIPGYEIAAKNVPSRVIGGDFYDFVLFDESHIGIVIADVSGKGIPAAILMASARASLRAYLKDPHCVGEVMTELNHVLCRDTRSEQFVTLFNGMLDIEDGTMAYVNAGHNAPILIRDHECISLDKGGPILGILDSASYEEGAVHVSEGDILLFYTDGITEAERNGRHFGERRLLQLIRSNVRKHTAELLETIFGSVAEFSGNVPQSDDRTAIVLQKLAR